MVSSDSGEAKSLGFGSILQQLLGRQELSLEQIQFVVGALMAGTANDVEAAALLTAWRAKGETAFELASAASILRNAMIKLEANCPGVIDTCGTGGDGMGTFNISTATALVVAGAGVPVAKHGNRAVTSRSGASDLLKALGVQLQGGPEWPRKTLSEAGLAFCFAPEFHPALARVASVRKRLGFRTVFNCLGPLANPAGAAFQIVGVGSPELLESMSGALVQLEIERAFVVVGADGLDEVTLTGPTHVREVNQGRIHEITWHPADFGLPACSLQDLAADGPEQSANIVHGILNGFPGPCRNVVLANAAAALLAAGRVQDLRSGVGVATASIESGRAVKVLERLKAI
jgi:anthranilate phosphoribosyltransferase